MALYNGGDLLITGSYLNFSPRIKKKNPTPRDYLVWALEDARKPHLPYDGFGTNEKALKKKLPSMKKGKWKRKLVKKLETISALKRRYPNKSMREIERTLYGKNISKIAIGTCRWAEGAERRLSRLEGERTVKNRRTIASLQKEVKAQREMIRSLAARIERLLKRR